MARDRRIEEERKVDPELNLHPRRRWWRTPISALLHRSTTLHDESDNESDSSKENRKNRRIQPEMIRRMNDEPKLINPSGWVSEGRMPTAQEGLVESLSIRSRSSIREPEPNSPTFVQQPGPILSQPSGRQPSELEVESKSELEDLSSILPLGRTTDRHISESGSLPYSKFTRWRCILPVHIPSSLSPTKSTTFTPAPTPWPFCC